MNEWYGYIHTDGTTHVKRYLNVGDLTEARESPFVNQVYGPWKCKDREDALNKIAKFNESYKKRQEEKTWMNS